MTDEKNKRTILGLSRFDAAVGGAAVLLTVVILAMALLANPARRGPAVAYLSPARGGVQDIWMTPLDNPEAAVQLTDSEMGIYNFGVSPDGRFIAYAERDPETRLSEIYLLNLATGKSTQLTNCVQEDADCRTPVFRQGSDVIAYERMTANLSLDNVGPGAIRIWLLDITSQPYTTRPLTDDSQFVGHSPEWSARGNTLAFYSSDIANPGVMVYNFAPEEGDRSLKFVPSTHGVVGTLSPNGQYLVFPESTWQNESVVTHLKIADLMELSFENLTDPQQPIEDTNAAWHPDGQFLAIERRYTDERYTRGAQIYLLHHPSGEIEPLVVDERYNHGFFVWDDAGEHLLFQRFALFTETGEVDVEAAPEVWIVERATGELTQIADNAFHPRWVTP